MQEFELLSVSEVLYLFVVRGVAAKVENGDATMTNDANVDVDRMKLRRVDIAKRVVALRLILLNSIIISYKSVRVVSCDGGGVSLMMAGTVPLYLQPAAQPPLY